MQLRAKVMRSSIGRLHMGKQIGKAFFASLLLHGSSVQFYQKCQTVSCGKISLPSPSRLLSKCILWLFNDTLSNLQSLVLSDIVEQSTLPLLLSCIYEAWIGWPRYDARWGIAKAIYVLCGCDDCPRTIVKRKRAYLVIPFPMSQWACKTGRMGTLSRGVRLWGRLGSTTEQVHTCVKVCILFLIIGELIHSVSYLGMKNGNHCKMRQLIEV